MQFAGATWTQFVNFFVVVLFYHMAVIQYNWTRHGIQQAHCDNDSSVHEEVCLCYSRRACQLDLVPLVT